MERIRSAIEKARAEREQRAGRVQEPAAPAPVAAEQEPVTQPLRLEPSAERARDVEEAWIALPSIHPKPSVMKRNRIVTFDGGLHATYFDVLRTRLLKQLRANGWRRVAITSPGSACGKTTVALNLAFSLARQPEVRSMLMELDLRRPSMAKLLGLKKQQLFARVLEGTDAAEDHLVRYGTNLAIGTNYRHVPNSAELMMNSRVGEALAAIEEHFDPQVMLFDMPPMMAGDDTSAFLDNVDCVLLVGAAESTTIKEIDLTEQDLARQTNVLGVVLNKCRYLEEGQGYAYYDY